jgi:hypothetical protein
MKRTALLQGRIFFERLVFKKSWIAKEIALKILCVILFMPNSLEIYHIAAC